jgi:hypothetical protein
VILEVHQPISFRPSPSNTTSNPQPTGAEVITDWVVSYFSPPASPGHHNPLLNVHDALRGASPVTTTDRMPLILQHNGHSSTIVGYEVSKTGAVNLLKFDPAR